MPERFNYFDMAEVSIAAKPIVIGRSGFTSELDWELYLTPDIDIAAVDDHVLEVGGAFGMITTTSGMFRARASKPACSTLGRTSTRPPRRLPLGSAVSSISTRVTSSDVLLR